MRLVICEKPSVAAAIAAAIGAGARVGGHFEGNGHAVANCLGHLLELAAPDAYGERYAKWRREDLPILPEKWLHTPRKGTEAQLAALAALLNRKDIEYVVNACDAGREGELIFRLVYEHAKATAPIKRLWLSSLEENAIREGFADLRDGGLYDGLYAAASCRERADWLVGMNATRLFSTLYGATLNVGRVQSPTLAMLAEREDEIANFTKEPFYTPTLELAGLAARGEKNPDKVAADAIAADCDGKAATVMKVERALKTLAPPKLHDLTSLQREANKALGYTAQQTLDHAQALYEARMLTYPRTDSRNITADMVGAVAEIVGDPGFEPDVERLVGPVTDHHAIIPTLESTSVDTTALPRGEREVYGLVLGRLIAATAPRHVYEAVTTTLECGGHTFTAKGKAVIEQGWKAVQGGADDGEDEGGGEDGEGDGADEESGDPPGLAEGQTLEGTNVAVREGFTKPKPHHTEASILAAMEGAGAEAFKGIDGEPERKGLGTSATRAAIIEALVKRGYAERSKKNLLPTAKGRNLAAILPDDLKSAGLTARWEGELLRVQRGELEPGAFMTRIGAFMTAITLSEGEADPAKAALFADAKRGAAPGLGRCPRCGGAVREGGKGYFCDGAGCGFRLWKAGRFWAAKRKELTPDIVSALLRDGRARLTGLHSEKTGKKYDATAVMDDDGGEYVNFRLEFDARGKGKR